MMPSRNGLGLDFLANLRAPLVARLTPKPLRERL
jgi:hypothetical protein